jgi:hypothetical protein
MSSGPAAAAIAQQKVKRRKVLAVPDAVTRLHHSFFDLQLAIEASQGHAWAYLDSYGVPFPAPVDVAACSIRYLPPPLQHA